MEEKGTSRMGGRGARRSLYEGSVRRKEGGRESEFWCSLLSINKSIQNDGLLFLGSLVRELTLFFFLLRA